MMESSWQSRQGTSAFKYIEITRHKKHKNHPCNVDGTCSLPIYVHLPSLEFQP
jgi:hypothetical protein